MKVLVTKPFAYSATGIAITHRFVAGDEPDLNDACIDGLLREGFITVDLPPAEQVAKAKSEVPPQTVVALQEAVAELKADEAKAPPADGIVIPEDWRSIKWFSLKSLAQKIAGRDVADSDDARAIVEAELVKRAA